MRLLSPPPSSWMICLQPFAFRDCDSKPLLRMHSGSQAAGTRGSRKREREEEPSALWQSFGLAQPGDRVGLATTPRHRGLTAIVKRALPDHHWPSILCVTLEGSEQEVDVKRSEVKLLSASSSTLAPEPLSDPGRGTLCADSESGGGDDACTVGLD